jgi:hypothetical protein
MKHQARDRLLGAATLALAGVALWTGGCGATSTSKTSTGAAHGPPTSNQRVLSAAESEHLVAWSRSFRSCLVERGFAIGRPQPMHTRIELTVTHAPSFQDLIQAGVKCGDSLGGPPPRSSLQTFKDTIVLYLPKQCLLDQKVENRSV